MSSYASKAAELVAAKVAFVTVTLVQPEGHVPQDIGAKAIVDRSGLVWGTVGGGRLEARAIHEAQKMLQAAASSNEAPVPELKRYDLQQDLGMVCGGAATLFYEAYSPASWRIAVFGAGHVAQATIPVIAGFSCQVLCLDTRAEWLSRLPECVNLQKIHTPDLPGAVSQVPTDAFYVVMTQGHATDLPIVREILKRGMPRYLGVIGSLPKARTLRAALQQEGFGDDLLASIICPIGFPIGTNAPQEIAVSIAAQLLEKRDAPKL